LDDSDILLLCVLRL